jgi:hypothetical protein
VYPYEDLNLNFTSERFNVLHDMYASFQRSFYGKNCSNVILSKEAFKTKAPLIVIDCSHQPENVKTGAIDMKIELQFSENLKAETSCSCLIFYDRVFEYSVLKNDVKRII